MAEKWELISSHIGKKTFVMFHVEAGTPIHVLAALTGNNMDSLKHYYKITHKVKEQYCKKVESHFSND